MFWSKSTHTLASRDVTLSFSLTRDFPAGCLLCLVKEVIYFPNPRIKANLNNPPKSQRALLLERYPKADKCEHSWSQLLGSACERGSGAQRLHKMPSLWLALTFSIHSFKLLIQTPSVSPWQRIKGQDTCKEPDYVLEAGSRRRIRGIAVMWRVDFSRCKALLCYPVRKTQPYR